MKLTRDNLIDIRNALYRAIDWSDVNDNAHVDAGWTKRERVYLKRLKRMQARIAKELAATGRKGGRS